MRGVVISTGFGNIQYGQHSFTDIQGYTLGQAIVFFNWIMEETNAAKKSQNVKTDKEGKPVVYPGAKYQSKKHAPKSDAKEVRWQQKK